jgi:hypothetical protein
MVVWLSSIEIPSVHVRFCWKLIQSIFKSWLSLSSSTQPASTLLWFTTNLLLNWRLLEWIFWLVGGSSCPSRPFADCGCFHQFSTLKACLVPLVRYFLSVVDTFGFLQHVNQTTHIGGDTLDLVISKESDNLLSDCFVTDLLTDLISVHWFVRTHRPLHPRKMISLLFRSCWWLQLIFDPVQLWFEGFVGSSCTTFQKNVHHPSWQYMVQPSNCSQ